MVMWVACRLNDEDQCNIPDLPEGETYIQVSARHSHTVLLKSDGHVVGLAIHPSKKRAA